MDFPIPPEFWWSTDILSSLMFLQGVDQEILPYGQGRIDSVKINPSLLMMRECGMFMTERLVKKGNFRAGLLCAKIIWTKPIVLENANQSFRQYLV